MLVPPIQNPSTRILDRIGKYKSIRINILIFSIAALQFGLETALYSILTYFTATRCIDYVVEGLQAKTGVTIISGKSEIIKYQLVNHLGRGITVYKGEQFLTQIAVQR